MYVSLCLCVGIYMYVQGTTSAGSPRAGLQVLELADRDAGK